MATHRHAEPQSAATAGAECLRSSRLGRRCALRASFGHVAVVVGLSVVFASCAERQGLSGDGGIVPLDGTTWVASVTHAGATSLYVLSEDRDPVRLTTGNDVTPSVSPNRRLVAFSRLIEGRRRQLWTLDRSTREERQVLTTPNHDYSPVFVSDREIVFLRATTDRETSTFGHRWVGWDLYQLDIVTGAERALTSRQFSEAEWPGVDRVGRRVGLLVDPVRAEPASIAVALTTGEISELGIPEPSSLTLDPRGLGIVFSKQVVTNDEGLYIYELFKAGPRGENAQRLTRLNAALFGQQHSFDGDSVTAFDGMPARLRVWSIPLDGRPPRLLALRLP